MTPWPDCCPAEVVHSPPRRTVALSPDATAEVVTVPTANLGLGGTGRTAKLDSAR
ncbi:hypothetical protein ACIRL2_44385 [Embleya sp. NPDC127516]|uniref:hypothetical protein n=1 Tax=Embleya sp. NPDC127516 TaxID=3363990 RepID=UPI00381BBBDB